MIFYHSLYIALAVFVLGVVLKMRTMFSSNIGIEKGKYTFSQRFFAVVNSIFSSIFSNSLPIILKAFFFNVLLQRRIFQNSKSRWMSHMCISYGFLYLFLFHAMDHQITKNLLPHYESTLNPYLFLRNFAGFLVIAGGVGYYFFRIRTHIIRLENRLPDKIIVSLLFLIIISGFVLETFNKTSERSFNRMVKEYCDYEEGDIELNNLKLYWNRKYSVAFENSDALKHDVTVEAGRLVHEEYCATCHSHNQSAFVSYSFSKIIQPFGVWFDKKNMDTWVWYIHFFCCFIALAILPFTKLFHILTTPLLLLINSVCDPEKAGKPVMATLRGLELSACMYCTTCSAHCKVALAFREIHNRNLLPSEKLAALIRITSGRFLEPEELESISEGAYICASCYNCTLICPAGINLQDLWFAMKKDLIRLGYGEVYIRTKESAFWDAKVRQNSDAIKISEPNPKNIEQFSADAQTFKNCFTCMECTNSCPVVFLYQKPRDKLDMLPHQIVRSLSLGLVEEAMGARMVWDCLTCYRCQEACPQGVQVTELLNELRNIFYRSRNPGRSDVN